MYIEHTNLEDNLHQILTNRVPTSSSPSASEATAALLARVREAHSSASSALQQPVTQQATQLDSNHSLQNQQPQHFNYNSAPSSYKFPSEWSRRPEPKLLPLETLAKSSDIAQQLRKKLESLDPQTQKKVDQVPQEEQQKAVNGSEEPEIEEEQYELLQVIDTEQPTLQTSNTIGNVENSRQQEEVDNIASTSHFVIELKEKPKISSKVTQPLRQRIQVDEDEEFEYIVTRVPKRKSQEIAASQVNFCLYWFYFFKVKILTFLITSVIMEISIGF